MPRELSRSKASHSLPPLLPMGRGQQVLLWILILVGIGSSVYLLRGVLMPFMIALMVAYCFSPLVLILKKLYIPRPIGSLILLVTFFLGLGFLFFLAFPFARDQILSLTMKLPNYGANLQNQMMVAFDKFSTLIPQHQWDQIQSASGSYISDVLTWIARLLGSVLSSGVAIANMLTYIIVIPLVSFYCLMDWPRITETVRGWIPIHNRTLFKSLIIDIDKALSGFIRGQALVCLILATYYGVSLWMVDLEFGLILGLLTGIFAFIPYLGFLCCFLIAIIMAFIQFDAMSTRLVILGIFGIGQVLEGSFLTPFLVGNRVGLHPVWIIFALLSGGYLMGLSGVILAMPVAAVLGVLIRFSIKQYKESPLFDVRRASPTRATSIKE